MNLQCPKFIMRNNSIGIETLPTLALFLHTSSLTFCNHLTHTMSAYSVLDVSIVSSVSGVSSVPGVSRQREKPNQVCSMVNLQFACFLWFKSKRFRFSFPFSFIGLCDFSDIVCPNHYFFGNLQNIYTLYIKT